MTICGSVVMSFSVKWFVKDFEISPVYLMYRRAYFLKMFFLAGLKYIFYSFSKWVNTHFLNESWKGFFLNFTKLLKKLL